jgi:endonuclease/exonuclease/phosphatase family metal-dependent hydrolase
VQFSVRAGEASAQVRDADSLTVATYNVHGLRNRAGVRRDLAALDDVLVWCLQEVPYAGDRELESILPPGAWHVAVIPVNRDAKRRQWESQVIASRFPIGRVGVWPLDDRGAKRRVALAAQIDVGGRTVRVVNTDHEPSMLAWRDGNTLQAQRLAERVRTCSEEFVIVAGDFNCAGNLFRLRGNTANVRHVDHTLAGAGLTPLATTEPTFRSGLLRSRLDRIYARGMQPVAGAIASASRGSDHFPVWGRFAFRDSAATSRRTSLANDALHPVSSGHAEGDAGPTVSSGD